MKPAEISINPNVMVGKPVIAGTRITVELILEKLAAGESHEQIFRSYPHLPPGSIEAALSYAVGVIRNEVPHPANCLAKV